MIHVKSLIFDEKVLLVGSVNMTHNGMENNKEQMFRITDPSAFADVMADFEKEWAAAEQVTSELIGQMMSQWENKEEKKEDQRGRSASRSLDRGISRSLSRELDGVKEEPAEEPAGQ